MSVSGPLFDGTAQAALKDGIEAVRRQLASEAEKRALAAFQAAIRSGTGRFERSVTQARSSGTYTTYSGGHAYSLPVVVEDAATDIAVTTDLATYGPWLEGVGSRNETTRFKGYHGFRMAAQETASAAQGIADRAIAPYVNRMS